MKNSLMFVLSITSLLSVSELATAAVSTIAGVSTSYVHNNYYGRHWITQSGDSDFTFVQVVAEFKKGINGGGTLLDQYDDDFAEGPGAYVKQLPSTETTEGEVCRYYTARTSASFTGSASGAADIVTSCPWVNKYAPHHPDSACP